MIVELVTRGMDGFSVYWQGINKPQQFLCRANPFNVSCWFSVIKVETGEGL